MADLPLTTTQLLDRLRCGASNGAQGVSTDPSAGAHAGAAIGAARADQHSAWNEVDARYRPVLIGFTRSLGLSEADAEDAAQWTLAELSRGLRAGHYERGKGRLRSWVMGIARNRVLMIQRSKRQGPTGPLPNDQAAGVWPPTPPDEATMSVVWERELERTVFTRAWGIVRDRFDDATLRMFELVSMRGVPPAAAAAECAVPVDRVYVAKSRVTKALREISAELMSRYGADE